MLVMVNWKPPKTKAIRTTANIALETNTEAITEGIIINPPTIIAVFRALSTVFPDRIKYPENQPPVRLPIIAPK